MPHLHQRTKTATPTPSTAPLIPPRPSSPSVGASPSTPRPLLASRTSYFSTASLGRGLATVVGTAATLVGNAGDVKDRAKAAVDTYKDRDREEGQGRFGVRSTVGGWLGRGKPAEEEDLHDRLILFPGWAVKAPVDDKGSIGEEDLFSFSEGFKNDPNAIKPFEIHLHVSGFATQLRPPGAASRTQRLFTRMATNFADLPRLESTSSPSRSSSVTPSIHNSPKRLDEDLSDDHDHDSSSSSFFTPNNNGKERQLTDSPSSSSLDLPELPSAEPDDINSSSTTKINASPSKPSPLKNHRSPSRSSSAVPVLDRSSSASFTPTSASTSSSQIAAADALSAMQSDLYKLHENLRRRLQPFFASVIPNRQVLLEVRPKLATKHHGHLHAPKASVHPSTGVPEHEPEMGEEQNQLPALLTMQVTTSLNGNFIETLKIPWSEIVESPECLPLIFPEKLNAAGHHVRPDAIPWALEVTAKLLPLDQPITDWPPYTASEPKPDESTPVLVAKTVTPLSKPTGVRVISDMDDTVKRTDLMHGLREVFRNVFCRDDADLEVAGMSALFRSLVGEGEGGVEGWHYVSNSPYELYDPIYSFLTTNQFPPGFSLRLKFYGGRSLFKGLWEEPGERKLRGVLEILNGYPDAKFLLFGDSAEQDLDLYSQIATERPHQVLGIFIREISIKPIRSSSSSSSPATSSRPSFTSTPSSPSLATPESPGRVHRIASSMRPGFTRTSSSGSLNSLRSRSRSSSLLNSLSSDGEPSTTYDALSPNNPLPDLQMPTIPTASTSPSKNPSSTTTASISDSLSTSAPSSSTTPDPITSIPRPTISEDTLDPLVSGPPSPSITPEALENPDAVVQEALTSAELKQKKRAAEFKGRFEAAKEKLEPKGVRVIKFGEVSEMEELVRELVFGKGGKGGKSGARE